MVVAPKGPSSVFSHCEARDRARRRDVYTGLVPQGLLSLRGAFGAGGNSQPIPGKPTVTVARGTDTPPQQMGVTNSNKESSIATARPACPATLYRSIYLVK